jgi:ubiquinone biosynthesis protein UbiJ
MTDSIQLPAALLAGVEVILNRCLTLDADARARVADLSGKVIALELRGVDTVLFLAPHRGGVRVMSSHTGPADTTLRGTPGAFLRLGATARPAKVLFSGDVEISGDVELGRTFKRILDDMEIDWEEQLSLVTGDIVAHRIGNMVRDTARWLRNTAETLGLDLAEYLHEETRVLPQAFEIEGFLADVDTLRSDCDRLEQRLERLRRAQGEDRP